MQGLEFDLQVYLYLPVPQNFFKEQKLHILLSHLAISFIMMQKIHIVFFLNDLKNFPLHYNTKEYKHWFFLVIAVKL